MNICKRGIALAMCAIMVSMAIAGPILFVAPQNAAAADPVRMTIGTLQDPGTLNPFSMVLSMAYTISFLMYDTLNSVEPDLSSGPQLARTWYHNDDGTVWYYNTSQDAYWHDDVQVTAEDVAFTFNLILDNPKDCALWVDYLANITDVTAVNDFQVRITTEVPKATMLSINVPILPKHVWELIPLNKLTTASYSDTNYFPNGGIGSGVLKLEEYVRDDYILMSKWDRYYIDTANVDEVLYKIYTDPSAMMNALYSGELDVATGVSTESWSATLAKPSIEGQAVKSLSLFELGVNCMPEDMRENFPQASENLEMNNLSVRQAIAMCVNRTYLVDTVLSGLAEEGSSLIPNATAQWHYNVPADEEFKFDLEAAGALLDAAGYRDENHDGTRENVTSGVELADLIFYYRNDVPVADQLAAEHISDNLALIGIDAPDQGIAESTMYTYWYQARYDLYIWAWDTDVDPSFMLSVMTTDQIPDDPTDWTAWSDCFYANPVYDALFIEQQNTVDFEDRQTIVHEMQQILYRDCPYIVLWYPYGLYAYRTDRFYNFPDMETYSGSTPGSMWFFFDVTPIGANTAPYDVDAGSDQTVLVNTELSFTGSAADIETPNQLTYEWTFTEPDDSESTLSGSTVSYLFENIGVVDVMLTVSDPDGMSTSDSLQVTVDDVPVDSGWIIGRVIDSSEAPIASATVTGGIYSVSTNATGDYNLTLVAGTYTVTASKAGYGSSSAEVTVEAATHVTQNFTLAVSVGSISGIITDADTGLPIEGATVKLIGTTKIVNTNVTGAYSFASLVAGTYTVNVSKNGYISNETEVEVVAGEVTEVNMYMSVEPSSSSEGGISGTLLAVIGGIIALIVVALIVSAILKRKKNAAPPPEEPPVA